MARLFDAITDAAVGMTFAFVVLTALEWAWPVGRRSLGSRVRALAFWGAWIPATAVLAMAFRKLWDAVGISPLLTVPLGFDWAGGAAVLLAPFVGAIIGDFFFYWFHRAQHRWFWRYHAVHHSIRELSAVSSYHHPSEEAVRTLLYVVPTSLIVAEPGPALPMLAALLWLHPIYLHSPTRLSFGPLRAVIADNRFHRIHHSVEPRHFDHNFGAFTTVWDRLFGTAWFPARDEWPETGLAEVDEPRTVAEWVSLPARYRDATRREQDHPSVAFRGQRRA